MKEDFRKNPSNNMSQYVFAPRIHGLILALLDTGYFDNRKNDRKLDTRESLFRDLTVNIKLYLNNEDRKLVESNPAFANAACEGIISEAIRNKLIELIQVNMHSDETVRLKLLKRTYDTISDLIRVNEDEANNIMICKMVYKHVYDSKDGGEYLAALFGEDNLIGFLINLLALKMKLDVIEKDDIPKLDTYMSLYAWTKELGKAQNDPLWQELMVMNSEQINELKEKLKVKATMNIDYKKLMDRANDFFDHNNPEELQLLSDLELITRDRILLKQLKKENMKIIKRFYEASFAKDMYDMINDLFNGNLNTQTIREFQRIDSIAKIRNQTGKQS